jgi:hypothetical protein
MPFDMPFDVYCIRDKEMSHTFYIGGYAMVDGVKVIDGSCSGGDNG